MSGQYWARLYAVDPSNPDVMEATSYVIYAEEYYNGKLYESLIDGNVYSPSAYPAGWKEV